ncbi:MAG: hypothetical protein ACRD2W_18070 [Acidimicrobiales bacterium]
MRLARGGAAALVLLAGLGACSDGRGSESSSPTTAPLPGATTAVGGIPAPAADYCGLARLYAKAFERFGQPGTSLELRSYYRDATAAMDQALPLAPAEIRSDLPVVADGLKALVAGLEGIGYDFSRVSSLPPNLIARMMSQQLIQASTKVATYSRDTCGIP